MAFDTLRKQYTKEHFWYCEVEVNNSTYRFCEDRYTLPVGFSGIPTMTSQTMSPAKIDMAGGLGVRATSSVSMNEHQDYTIYGTASAPVRFWANWRARNAGYQGGRLSIFSGYITDNTYELNNFQRRDYVIESFSMSEKGVSITAKDTLKLASNDRAKAPQKSGGRLSTDLLIGDTSITLLPTGVGNSEYPSSGFGRMGEEVVSFTRSGDTVTIVRGQYNTIASEHSEDDAFQLCLRYNASLSDILYDLLTEYASVPDSQINKVQWDNESFAYYPGAYSTLITEPVGVSALLKELGETAPHYLFWDERVNSIVLNAVKAPPDSGNIYTPEANFLNGSVSIKDRADLRISTVIINYGQKDPTQDLDQINNYKQGYIRITPDSVAKYNNIQAYKVVNSRWITDLNRAAAVRLAARWGRRFEDIPREFSFSMDSKDGNVWTGDSIFVNSGLILDDATYNRYDMPVQIISAGESKDYKYTAIEHTYGVELPQDLSSDDPNQRLVVINGTRENINLRAIYDIAFPNDLEDDYDVLFLFESSSIVGSSSLAGGIVTGSWPSSLVLPIRLDTRGLISGKGGNGASIGGADASNGGTGITMGANIRLSNTGIIGGGGAGGDRIIVFNQELAGGGGAGTRVGLAGTGSNNNGGFAQPASDGTAFLGGSGGSVESGANGESGGNLGQSTSVASAGKAIALNGFTITYLSPVDGGDIRGAVS